MAQTACLVCPVSTVCGHHKNAFGKGSNSSRHITKLEKSTFSLDIYGLNAKIPAQHSKDEKLEYPCLSMFIIHISIHPHSLTDKHLEMVIY